MVSQNPYQSRRQKTDVSSALVDIRVPAGYETLDIFSILMDLRSSKDPPTVKRVIDTVITLSLGSLGEIVKLQDTIKELEIQISQLKGGTDGKVS